MNKDVIYIEPEDDITDILAKVKNAKNKIVALVPPKKAGVLRSAVNIKLIAKTAARSNKTTVLISSDESIMKLAMAANIPVAKTLQSKPQLPKDFSRPDLGEEPSDVIEAKKPETKAEKKEEAEEVSVKKSEKVAEKADDEVRPPFKVAKDDDSKKPESKEDEEVLELDSEDLEEKKSVRGAKKALTTKVPNFKKYLKFIIAGGVALVLIIAFVIYAKVSAHADINVKIKTSETNFAEKVTFVTGEDSANAEEGIFYVEQKTVDKKVETEFEATGKLDKGQKAVGSIQVTIPSGTAITTAQHEAGVSIGAGTVFVFGEVAYKATEGRSISKSEISIKCKNTCFIDENVSFGAIPVEAVENGDKYNIGATTSGWSLNSTAWYAKSLKFASSEMTGGSSEIVKVVSKDDIEKAKTSITMPSDDQIREELAGEFDSDYLIIKSSLNTTEPKYTSDPDLEGEVKDDKKPKLTLERSYSVYAVKRSDVNAYISKKATANIGDNTQTIYSTGVSGFEKKLTSSSDTSAKASKDTVFFDSYKNQDGEITAKLKSVVLTAPEVSEDMILENALGNKKSDVYRKLKSINGVSEVTVDVKPFSTIPKDQNRVNVTIELIK